MNSFGLLSHHQNHCVYDIMTTMVMKGDNLSLINLVFVHISISGQQRQVLVRQLRTAFVSHLLEQ